MCMQILRSLVGWLKGLRKGASRTVGNSTEADMPEPVTLPYLDANGDHVFVVESILNRDGAPYPAVRASLVGQLETV